MMAQRNSDANKDVAAGRVSAFSKFSEVDLRIGSLLEDQFQTNYLSRVYPLTMPWCVGGPDFANKPRQRRCYADAPKVNLDAFTAMMSQRCESQFRTDWDFNPGLWSLAFASKINLPTTMSITRALRRGGGAKEDEVKIGAAAARIYMLLRQGEYMDAGGNRRPVNGDISKIHQMIGLSNVEKALLTNYHFMSSRFAGTRQIRNSIRHIVFSSRVFYGLPLYGSLTPSERHSGLILRLYRCRQTDPAITTMSKNIRNVQRGTFLH